MPRIEPHNVRAVSGARGLDRERMAALANKRGGLMAGLFVAYLVWSVTPIAWLTLLVRFYKKGTLLSMPTRNVFAKFWYVYSLFEAAFSIYLQYITRQASRRVDPPQASPQALRLLLTKSLLAGLPPAEGTEFQGKQDANGTGLQGKQDANGTGLQGKQDANGTAPAAPRMQRSYSATARLQEDAEKGQGYASSIDYDDIGLSALRKRPVDPQDAQEVRQKLRSWFHFIPLEDIWADNIREWLAWAFAGRDLEDAQKNPEIKALLDEGVEMLKYRLQWPYIHEGYNPGAVAIRLTLDRVKAMNRPLGHYVVTNGVTQAAITWLRLRHGFKYEKAGQCWFLVKAPVASAQSNGKKSLPILFLHGLGIGLGQYVPMLAQLAQHKDGVVILIQPHISQSIYSRHFLDPPSKDDQALATLNVLARHRMTQVTTLSHSNGTMVLGWLLRTKPEVFPRNILVDPVSFCLWEGSVCYSFIYQQWQTGIEALLGYFVGREIGIAHTIGRRFIWFDMVLWADELPKTDAEHLHVVFGERDLLVDVRGSVHYLRHHGIPDECISVMKDYQHGQALMHHGEGMRTSLRYAGLRI